jgi:hypothetical protein
MSLKNDEASNKIEIKNILLLIGITGIGFNLFYKYDRYYLGDTLIEKRIVVNDPPEYVETGKGGTDRYTLSGQTYLCRFWISEGGLAIVRDNQDIENKIKGIKKGDSIIIKIRQTDQSNLQNESARLRIIELTNKNEQLLKAIELEAKDRKWYYINFGVPIVALIIGLTIQVRQMVLKKRNQDLT